MQIDEDLKIVMLTLLDFFQERKIPFVIIGALVPAVLIDLKKEDTSRYGSRTTRDVDCTVKIDSWEEYHEIKKEMLACGFKKEKGSPEHRLFFGDIPIDILPCGDNFIQQGMLQWPESDHQMNVRGFSELFNRPEMVIIDGEKSVPFAPLSLSVYLKIQAFLDRNDPDDLEDIFYILVHYEEVETSERRFEVITEDGLYYEIGGAFLAGQDLKELIPSELVEGMSPFLKIFKDPEHPTVLKAAQATHQKPEDIMALISAFQKGLEVEG